MRKALLIASALLLLPVAARADGLDWRDWYRKLENFTESLIAPAPPRQDGARVPAAGIDPKMALIPRGDGRMRVIAPPGTDGGDPKVDPR